MTFTVILLCQVPPIWYMIRQIFWKLSSNIVGKLSPNKSHELFSQKWCIIIFERVLNTPLMSDLSFMGTRSFKCVFQPRNVCNAAQKMKFSIKDFFSNCDQIESFLWIWSYLLKKSLMENFIFCVVFSWQVNIWIKEHDVNHASSHTFSSMDLTHSSN